MLPGRAIIQNAKNIMFLASEIISPQEGKGGCTPSPRNESAASSKIALAASTVATTTSCGNTFGRTSRRMIRGTLAPAASAAAT